MKIFKTIIFLGILTSIIWNYGCSSMDDNYKQYTNEYNYSGKIDSLRVYPGFERVILAWDNPKDQKSKTIKIVYGVDSTEVEYDSMVDSVSIDGLNEGTGYEFTIYTMDSQKNISVPTSITAFPVSKEFVESLTPPSIIVKTNYPKQFLSLVGLSNVLMKFSGHIEFAVTGPEGFTKSGSVYLPELAGASDVDIPVSSLGVDFIQPGEYSFDYKVSVWPILGNIPSVDEVWLDNKVTTNVEVLINLMKVPGNITESNNNSPGNHNEDVIKVIDDDSGTKYLTFVNHAWMMWKMDQSFAATYYTLTSGNDGSDRDPRDWTLEASNDGTNWTILDEHKDEGPFPARKYKKTFLIANKTAYTHYRLNVTKNNGGSIFQLADWILYYDSSQK